MRLSAFIVITTVVVLLPLGMDSDRSRELPAHSRKQITKDGPNLTRPCMPEPEVAGALRELSISAKMAEQQIIITTLRDNASQSPECRQQVITVVMAALRKANPDLLLDRPSLFLWHYGSKLLADLKAVEAMDLFIANLALHDGTPFPFNHYPAIGAIIDLGEEAIPTLRSTLEETTNYDTKRYAVFCLAQIGGKIAKQTLRDRLPFESNCCIRNSIVASLEAFENKTLPGHITSENRSEWYATFLCECDPAMRIKIGKN